jgi:hypothetical protein
MVSPHLTDSQIAPVLAAAHAFCELVESPGADASAWVEAMLPAVARLYASAVQLPELASSPDDPEIPESFRPSHEAWKQHYDRIEALLGTSDIYWIYFDPTQGDPEGPVCGSLADDLSDIYRDVIPALRAVRELGDNYGQVALYDLTLSFANHWGVHAVSALRALHPLALLRGIDDA